MTGGRRRLLGCCEPVPHPAGAVLLDVDRVSAHYDGRPALDGVSMRKKYAIFENER